MAKLTEREVVILVKALGLDKAIAGFGTLDKSIKQTQKSSGELDRNMKGSANITSNTTKAFAKQAQGLGGLVHVYATVAANVFALSSAFNVLKSNADLKIMEQASRQLSVASGTNFNLVAKSLKDVTGGAISMKEAMQTATLGLRGGATSVQIQQITEVATKAAKALGRSVPEAVTRLTQAVIKGEPELADEFGIILRIEEAVKKYAAAHNKAAKDLTTFERMQAMVNQAIDQGQKKYGMLKLDTNPYDKLAATFSELTQKILQFVSIPIGTVFGALADNAALLTLAILAFAKAIAQRALPEVFKLGAAMIDNAKKASANAIIAYNAQGEALDKLAKKQSQYAAVARTKKINLLGTLGDTGLKDAIPKLAKQIDAAKGDLGKISESLFRTFYSQIYKEAKKFGGDISKVMATNIKNPLQREFLLINQEMQKLPQKLSTISLNQTVAGVKLTVQELKYLNQAIQVYTGELTKGATSAQAMAAAQDKLAMSTIGVRAAFGKLVVEGRQLFGSFATLKLGITQGSQLMQQGALQGKNLKESVALVSKELSAAGVNLDRVNPRVLSFGVGIGKVIGSMSNFVGMVGSVIGGLFNLVMIVTLVWQGLQVLGSWLGITNSKFNEAGEKLDELDEAFKVTRASIAKYNEDILKSAESTEYFSTKLDLLKRKAAIFDTLAMHAKNLSNVLDELSKAGGEGKWDKFLVLAGIDKQTDTVKKLQNDYAQLKGSMASMGQKVTIKPEDMFKLVTPQDLDIKGALSGILEKTWAPDLEAAITSVFNPQRYNMLDAAGKFTEGFRAALEQKLKSISYFSTMPQEQIAKIINDIEKGGTQAIQKLATEGFGVYEQRITSATTHTEGFSTASRAATKAIQDANSEISTSTSAQAASLEEFGNAAKQTYADIIKSTDDLAKGTGEGFTKHYETMLGGLDKIKNSLEGMKGLEIDPFKVMLEQEPKLVSTLGLIKENFDTQEKAYAEIGRLQAEAANKLLEYSQFEAKIIKAEQELATAKRNTGLVDSKNFEDKKKALNIQYDAEEKLLKLELEKIELLLQAIKNRKDEIIAITNTEIALQAVKLAQKDITIETYNTNVARALGSMQNSTNELDRAEMEAKARVDALKAKIDELSKQRGGALGKVDSAASRSGESAADKAQAQAEKIANLEASIAKKRLERGAMFLALEKELGDAVESRMEWELTGAREAVGLGNKRLAILSREYSMSQALIPLKKAAMEAEARALEIKADGLEKDGEIKAAEEARLEVANKRQEMNNLDIEYVTLRLEYEQKLYDVALKQHDLRKRAMIPTFKEGSGIQGSEEFFQSAKVEFALRWDKFMDEMTSPVDRLLDAFEGAIDSGVDAFVEAIANGENALQAAGEAIKKTIFELAKEWLKEDIKSLLYSTVGSALGMEDPKEALKSELAKMAAQDKMQHTEVTGKMDSQIQLVNRSNGLLEQIATNTASQGTAGFGNLAGQMSNMFGMNQQQFTNVSAGLEGLFDQRPDLFGSNAGLSGQIDSMFAAQPDIFGAAPGYASAFSGTTPSFGLGGLGTSFMNMFGTAPTPATQPLGSSDIFSGSNPLGMSAGSMLNMTGMGGVLGPTSALTTGAASMGQSLLPSTMGQPTGMGAGVPQASMGGIGGMGAGLGVGSMMMSFLPMLMGGLGGGSPAGQAAQQKSSSDSAIGEATGGSDSESAIDDLKDETEELKDKTIELLTKIKDDLIDVKLNQIAFQIEHMEKIDKNFTMWLATFMLTHMQNLMLFTMMIGLLQQIAMQLVIHTTLLSQIAGCICAAGGGGGGMAKGGIVSGLVRGYKKGAITTGPELAMIGEGANREAIVPLPDNRSIPVTLTNQEEKDNYDETNPVYNITINGVEGTEKGLKRSAGQIAYEVDRLRRNKLARF